MKGMGIAGWMTRVSQHLHSNAVLPVLLYTTDVCIFAFVGLSESFWKLMCNLTSGKMGAPVCLAPYIAAQQVLLTLGVCSMEIQNKRKNTDKKN